MADRYKVDQRAALFGGRSRTGGNTIGRSADTNLEGHAHRETLEQQNDSRLSELEAKVSQLKDITRGIGRETKESLGFLDNLGATMDKAGSLLKGTLGQLTTMTSAKNGRSGLLICGFITLFVFLYFLSSLRGGGAAPGADASAPAAVALAGAKSLRQGGNATVDEVAGACARDGALRRIVSGVPKFGLT
eukprot:CAMPEP_0183555680 /NCGR_PEP_ID=MMETSP0371-20130417/80179_1 /TAXON_ID=268820 /ORGANISM="Peridinium aciculiferum, Strain PAER-2" /LENGTH=189 /DNA_ID=CAMNT_0025761967 /DNA_START=107 /DNA_END=673 /DNA_ORIENTATION=+